MRHDVENAHSPVNAEGSATAVPRLDGLRVLRPEVEPRVIPLAGHWAGYERPDGFNATLTALLQGTAYLQQPC